MYDISISMEEDEEDEVLEDSSISDSLYLVESNTLRKTSSSKRGCLHSAPCRSISSSELISCRGQLTSNSEPILTNGTGVTTKTRISRSEQRIRRSTRVEDVRSHSKAERNQKQKHNIALQIMIHDDVAMLEAHAGSKIPSMDRASTDILDVTEDSNIIVFSPISGNTSKELEDFTEPRDKNLNDSGWSDTSEEDIGLPTASSSGIAAVDVRRTRSEPCPQMFQTCSKSSKARKDLSLPNLHGYNIPNMSELEFAHLLYEDEGDGDVGDVDSSDEELSDTEAEAGTTSTDNESLENLLEDISSSWSDLSLIVEGISVRKEYEIHRPHLVTQIEAMPRTKSAFYFKAPRTKPKPNKRSASESILPNKESKNYYNDCIGKRMEMKSASDTLSSSSSYNTSTGEQATQTGEGAFLTEVEVPDRIEMRTAGAGGDHDPHHSSSSSSSSTCSSVSRKISDKGEVISDWRNIGDSLPSKGTKMGKENKEYKLRRTRVTRKASAMQEHRKPPYNERRKDPQAPRYWTKPKLHPFDNDDTQSLKVRGRSTQSNIPSANVFTNQLVILPAIAASRPLPMTAAVENKTAIQALEAFQSCFPLERCSLLYKYLKDNGHRGEMLPKLTSNPCLKKSSEVSLRIKPSYATVIPYEYDPFNRNVQSSTSRGFEKSTSKQIIPQRDISRLQETLARCKRIENELRSNSEKGITQPLAYPRSNAWKIPCLRGRPRQLEVENSKRDMISNDLDKLQPSIQHRDVKLKAERTYVNTVHSYAGAKSLNTVQLAPLVKNTMKDRLERKFNIKETSGTNDCYSYGSQRAGRPKWHSLLFTTDQRAPYTRGFLESKARFNQTKRLNRVHQH